MISSFLAFSDSNFLVTFSVPSISSLISFAFSCLDFKSFALSFTEVLAFSNSDVFSSFSVLVFSNSDLATSNSLALSVSIFSAFLIFSSVASLSLSISAFILLISLSLLLISDVLFSIALFFMLSASLVASTLAWAFSTSCFVVLPTTTFSINFGVFSALTSSALTSPLPTPAPTKLIPKRTDIAPILFFLRENLCFLFIIIHFLHQIYKQLFYKNNFNMDCWCLHKSGRNRHITT